MQDLFWLCIFIASLGVVNVVGVIFDKKELQRFEDWLDGE